MCHSSRALIYIGCLAFVAGAISAAPADSELIPRIDAVVSEAMESLRIPGIAVAVVRPNHPPLIRVHGSANLETQTAVRTETVFELASLTKPFTAAAVLLLVDDGRVRLDDRISSYLADTPAAWDGITVRHLLTHTAGFPQQIIFQCDGSPLMTTTRKQELDAVAAQPPEFPAGTRALYSDGGYVLLGMIIETVTGQTYEEFLERRIFEPLGMSHSSVLDQSRIIHHRASPYSIRDRELVRGRRDWQVSVPAHFGVFSTVDDLIKFDAALRAETLIEPKTLSQMWSPATLPNGSDVMPFGFLGEQYGLGWIVGDIRGRRIAEHGGFAGTHMLRFIDDGITIIVLTNLDVASGNRPAAIARAIAAQLRPGLTHGSEPTKDPDPAHTKELEVFMRDLAEDRAPAAATDTLKRAIAALPPAARRQMGDQMRNVVSLRHTTTDVAPYPLRRMSDEVFRIRSYDGTIGTAPFRFTFWITKKGEVAYMRFSPGARDAIR